MKAPRPQSSGLLHSFPSSTLLPEGMVGPEAKFYLRFGSHGVRLSLDDSSHEVMLLLQWL